MIYAVGAFDGFHKGHLELLKQAQAMARNGEWGVATFDANPQFMLGQKNFSLLFSNEERDFYARCLDIPRLLKLPFTHELAALSPTEFMELMERKYNLTGIVVGDNFRFGVNRSGDTDFIKSYCTNAKIDFSIVPSVKIGSDVVSSTLIREMVANGKISETDKMLNFPYFASGTVIHGQQRGKKLGYPTANINLSEHKLYPKAGSYITLAFVEGKLYPSVTNIGFNPTFSGKEITCETHIVNFDSDIYGKFITVFFVEENRPEKKFNSIEELKTQLAKDVEKALTVTDSYIKSHSALIHKITAAFDRQPQM